jgi:hypothetical protein
VRAIHHIQSSNILLLLLGMKTIGQKLPAEGTPWLNLQPEGEKTLNPTLRRALLNHQALIKGKAPQSLTMRQIIL